MPGEKIEQRVNLKFLVKLKKKIPNGVGYIKLLKDVYGSGLIRKNDVGVAVSKLDIISKSIG